MESKGAKDVDDDAPKGGGAKGGDADSKGGGGGGFELDTVCDDWKDFPIYKGQSLSKGDALIVFRSDGSWKFAAFHSLVGDTLVATVRSASALAREHARQRAPPRNWWACHAHSPAFRCFPLYPTRRSRRRAPAKCTARPTGTTCE